MAVCGEKYKIEITVLKVITARRAYMCIYDRGLEELRCTRANTCCASTDFSYIKIYMAIFSRAIIAFAYCARAYTHTLCAATIL